VVFGEADRVNHESAGGLENPPAGGTIA